jgi:ribosome biogenesis protein NSA1
MIYITGDECGLIKEYNTAASRSHQKNSESSQYGIVAHPSNQDAASLSTAKRSAAVQCLNPSDGMSRQKGIVRITSLCSTHSEEVEFASLRMNGTIQLWKHLAPDEDSDVSAAKNREYHNFATIPNAFKEACRNDSSVRHPFSMGLLSKSCDAHNGTESKLAVCNTAGTVVIVDPKLYQDPVDNGSSDRALFTCFSMLGPQHQQVDSSGSNSARNCVVSAFCTHSTNHWIAMGGKERDIVVYGADNPSSGPIWKAKNLPPHPQTLLQPQIWPTAACFMNELNTDVSDSNHSNLLVIGTAYRQIRIYDLRMSQSIGSMQQISNGQRRPLFHTDEKQSIVDYRITAICPLLNHSFLIGDGGGSIISYDLRRLSDFQTSTDRGTSGKAVTGRFVGPAGSVRQLTTLPGQNHFACVGYDRMLRVYDVSSRKQRHMIYLKQRLNTVMMFSSGRNDDNDDDLPEDNNDIEQEDNVQDYSDSENESSEDEDDIVEEMIDALNHDDSIDEPEDSDDDDNDDEEQVSRGGPQKKRKWQ